MGISFDFIPTVNENFDFCKDEVTLFSTVLHFTVGGG